MNKQCIINNEQSITINEVVNEWRKVGGWVGVPSSSCPGKPPPCPAAGPGTRGARSGGCGTHPVSPSPAAAASCRRRTEEHPAHAHTHSKQQQR